MAHARFKKTLAAELNRFLDGVERNPLATVDWSDSIQLPELSELGVLKGLNTDQQQRLALLIAALWQVEQVVPWTSTHSRRRDEWRRQGAARLRKIVWLARRAEVALTRLDGYLKKLNVKRSARELFTSAHSALDRHALREVAERLEDGSLGRSARSRNDVMRILFRFFTRCGFPRAEAEVRVAKIGRHYWEWNYEIIEAVARRRISATKTLAADKRKGCEAVRNAVNRR